MAAGPSHGAGARGFPRGSATAIILLLYKNCTSGGRIRLLKRIVHAELNRLVLCDNRLHPNAASDTLSAANPSGLGVSDCRGESTSRARARCRVRACRIAAFLPKRLSDSHFPSIRELVAMRVNKSSVKRIDASLGGSLLSS